LLRSFGLGSSCAPVVQELCQITNAISEAAAMPPDGMVSARHSADEPASHDGNATGRPPSPRLWRSAEAEDNASVSEGGSPPDE
jgi:hypothetical protein